MSRRSEEEERRGRSPASVETRIRIPKTTAMGESSTSDAGNEPLVEDFHDRYVQPMSRDQPRPPRHPVISVSSPPDDGLPASPTFSQDEDDDDSEAPALPGVSSHGRITTLSKPSSQHAQSPNVAFYRSVPKQQRKLRDSGFYVGTASLPTASDSHERASLDSTYSQETTGTSIHTLPPLQATGYVDDADRLEPLLEDDPANFDLLAAPPEEITGLYQLEQRAEKLFSREHLEFIFADRKSLLKFTSFLNTYRPQSIPILIFYLDALKAIRAIKYANAVAEALNPISGYGFTETVSRPTKNDELQKKAEEAFGILVREDLPAYIAHIWIQVASVSIQRRITGTLAPHLREASEGLAEVFCLSDPSRKDNPIVFASEEFSRTTQYGMNYSIGRNCRFLQGPKTSPHAVRRLAEACKAPREHTELFVNYRRDGSPFMNLLMTAPLFDSKGTLRYFIGAQVDVSGLLKECTNLEPFARLIAQSETPKKDDDADPRHAKDEFQSLSEMFNTAELDTVKRFGGRMHRDQVDDDDGLVSHRPRLLLKDPTSELLDRATASNNATSAAGVRFQQNGKLEGVYQHYLLVRPAPSLRILFTSPSLRVPGILQSPFLSRIGGSPRVRAELAQAFTEGRGVTAKIRWLTRVEEGEDEGRSRWIHCTPLLGHTGAVGVWMVVLVDEEGSGVGQSKRRFRAAPPVSQVIGGKEYDGRAVRDKSEREKTRIEMMVPPHESQR